MRFKAIDKETGKDFNSLDKGFRLAVGLDGEIYKIYLNNQKAESWGGYFNSDYKLEIVDAL